MPPAPDPNKVTPTSLGRAPAWAVMVGLAALALAVRPLLGESRFLPSSSVLALLFGIALGALPTVRARLGSGAKRVSKEAIPLSIVWIGFGLDLDPLVRSGSIGHSLGIVVVVMATAFAAALLFGKALGLDPRMSLLLGAGTAVCGNSAIMAVVPTVQAKDEDVGLAIGVINLLGVVMLFALPPIGGALGVDGPQGGALAGLTVHAVPQAIATGEAFGASATEWATLFKLLRVAMLVPTVVLLAFVLARVRGEKAERGGGGVPWYVIAFVAAAGVRALGWTDATVSALGRSEPIWGWLREAGKTLLAVALAAIGIGLDLGTLWRVGPRVLLAATLAVAAMVAVALPLVRIWL